MNSFGNEAHSSQFGILSIEQFSAAGLRASPDNDSPTASTAPCAIGTAKSEDATRFHDSVVAEGVSAAFGSIPERCETQSVFSSGCDDEADAMAEAASLSDLERDSSGSLSASDRGDSSEFFGAGGEGSIGCGQAAVGGVPAAVQVGTVVIRGVPLVSLAVGGRLRVCLAQLSSTLLRDFSYNEIHNRCASINALLLQKYLIFVIKSTDIPCTSAAYSSSRVALGINCVQCNPMQLELLRRAGCVPYAYH